MPLPCPACARPMNPAAIVCPHCGARRPDVEPGLAGKALSGEEARALVAFHGVDPTPAQGLFPTLILPHPKTRGAARVAEIALTVVAFPLVVVGAVVFALGYIRDRDRREIQETTGELAPVLTMSLLGGLGLWWALSVAHVAGAATLGIVGGSVGALLVRAMLRRHASAERRRSLERVARVAPVKAPALPAARVVPARPASASAEPPARDRAPSHLK